MTTCLSDWPVEELPCVQADMSLLLIMVKQFCPGYSFSIFSQATPYFTFQFPPLCRHWVLTYFWLFFSDEREVRKTKESESREKELLGWSVLCCFRFHLRFGNMDSKRNDVPEDDAVLNIPTVWATNTHVGKRLPTESTFSPMSYYFTARSMTPVCYSAVSNDSDISVYKEYPLISYF